MTAAFWPPFIFGVEPMMHPDAFLYMRIGVFAAWSAITGQKLAVLVLYALEQSGVLRWLI